MRLASDAGRAAAVAAAGYNLSELAAGDMLIDADRLTLPCRPRRDPLANTGGWLALVSQRARCVVFASLGGRA